MTFGARCGAGFGAGAGCSVRGAAATTVADTALSALEFVSWIDSVRCGLTITRMAQEYERPATGCAVFARSVYVPTRSDIPSRPSRFVSPETESARSVLHATTLSSGSGFIVEAGKQMGARTVHPRSLSV